MPATGGVRLARVTDPALWGKWARANPTMRLHEVTRLSWGIVLLIAPSGVSRTLTGVRLDGRARAVARVLGVRHLTQALLLARTNGDAARRVGRVVDALHALSMIGLSTVDPTLRRPALADSALEGLFVLTGAGHPSHAEPDRQPTPAEAGDLARPALFVPEDEAADLRRKQDAQRQRAILDILPGSKGLPVEQVKRDLEQALAAREVALQPEPWMSAVASDAALGHIYVVSEQAMADTREVVPRHDPT